MAIRFGAGRFGAGPFGGGAGAGLVPVVSSVTGNACELAIDPLTGDLAIPCRLLRGGEAIAQKLRSRLLFFSGEWFLDQRLGMPYFDQILVKNPALPVVRSLFRRAILSVPGVVGVNRLVVTVGDPVERRGFVNFEAYLDDGAVLTADDEPFIVRERTV